MRFGLICQAEKFVVVRAPKGSQLRTDFPNFGVMLPSGRFYSYEKVLVFARNSKRGWYCLAGLFTACTLFRTILVAEKRPVFAEVEFPGLPECDSHHRSCQL